MLYWKYLGKIWFILWFNKRYAGLKSGDISRSSHFKETLVKYCSVCDFIGLGLCFSMGWSRIYWKGKELGVAYQASNHVGMRARCCWSLQARRMGELGREQACGGDIHLLLAKLMLFLADLDVGEAIPAPAGSCGKQLCSLQQLLCRDSSVSAQVLFSCLCFVVPSLSLVSPNSWKWVQERVQDPVPLLMSSAEPEIVPKFS